MNNELIKITTNEEGKRLVSAKELHEFLEVNSVFTTWFKRMCEYGFEENVDYTVFWSDSKNGNAVEYLGSPQKMSAKGYELNYVITIDMAKEISMLQRTEKGKEARKYFIECEKQLKETQNKAQLLLAIYNGGQEGVLASKQLAEIEVREATKPLLDKIEEDKPLVNFSNTVLKSSDNILVRELSKLAFDEGIKIGEKKLYNKLREWKYIMKDSTEPYQSAMNQGLFVVEEKPIKTPYGTRLSRTTKVTPKGQVFIIEKLKKLNNK